MEEDYVTSVVNIPINTLTAVYYIPSAKELLRTAILFGAVVRKHEQDEEYDYFELWTVDRYGETLDCRVSDNFLGVEEGGQQMDWTKEIKDYLDRQ